MNYKFEIFDYRIRAIQCEMGNSYVNDKFDKKVHFMVRITVF